MIEIKIPKKELSWDFVHKLDDVCKEFNLQACVIITEVIPVPFEQVTVKGELVVGEENND
jgi:hypothetical protein